MRTVLTLVGLFLFSAMFAVHGEEVKPNTQPLDDVRKEIVDGKAVLVDCREKDEWDAGHIKQARWLPLSDLKKTSQVPADLPRDRTVYVHCVSGKRAMATAQMLAKEGIHAVPLKEGFTDLTKSGFEKAQ